MAKKCTDGSTHCPYATHFFVKATILTFYIPISQTSTETKIALRNREFEKLGEKLKSFPREKTFGSRN